MIIAVEARAGARLGPPRHVPSRAGPPIGLTML